MIPGRDSLVELAEMKRIRLSFAEHRQEREAATVLGISEWMLR